MAPVSTRELWRGRDLRTCGHFGFSLQAIIKFLPDFEPLQGNHSIWGTFIFPSATRIGSFPYRQQAFNRYLLYLKFLNSLRLICFLSVVRIHFIDKLFMWKRIWLFCVWSEVRGSKRLKKVCISLVIQLAFLNTWHVQAVFWGATRLITSWLS